MADKVIETLVEALKQSLAEPGDQRLYRSGKLPGLFAARNGLSLEAATRAIQDGLLEVVRTDAKGKSETEWVRLTAGGPVCPTRCGPGIAAWRCRPTWMGYAGCPTFAPCSSCRSWSRPRRSRSRSTRSRTGRRCCIT